MLDAEQRAELQRRVRAGTSLQRDVTRARIILACEQRGSVRAVARQLGIHPRTVERWRARFQRHGLAGLQDQPRPGPPPKFGPVTRLELMALACEPIDGVAGRTTRTIAALVDEATARGLVDRISWSSYQRILAAADIRPHRIRGWLHSPDPKFREKVTEITALYLHPPAGAVVLSIDEKTGMQALERRSPDRPPAPGRPRRREFEYTRHGTQSLLCAFEVHRGQVRAECGPTRTAADLVRFMEQLAVRYPAGPVHVIWDCLNIHFDGREHRWSAFTARHGHRFVFHYTPKHASWVNQVELFFSILQRQCLRDSSFRSTAELRTAVLAFIAAWNRDRARPFRWTFTGYPLQAGLAMTPAKAA
jgi:transposase